MMKHEPNNPNSNGIVLARLLGRQFWSVDAAKRERLESEICGS
jgi:hypothetical protein